VPGLCSTGPADLQGKEVRQMLYLPSEKGQGIIEYALILVLVAIIVLVVLSLIGPAIGNVFSNIYNYV
jgi:pilus assembly protein Flp/PilA